MYESRLINACNCSLYAYLERSEKKNPEGVAVKYINSEMSYKQLLQSVKKTAAAMLALGINKGDNVIIAMPNVPQAVIAVYAVNMVGAISHVVHYMSTKEEIHRVVFSSGAKLAFCCKNTERSFDGEKITLITSDVSDYLKNSFSAISANKSLKQFKDRSRYFPAHVSEKHSFNYFINKKNDIQTNLKTEKGLGADTCVVLYDYSDNKMKNGISLSNTAVNMVAVQLNFFFNRHNIESGVLCAMPIYHGIGFAMCMHCAVMMTAPMVLVPEFSAKSCCREIFAHKPDLIFLSPTFFEEIIKSGLFENRDLSFIKAIGSTGNYQHQKLKIMMNELLKSGNSTARFISGYGRLECGCACTLELPYDGVSSEGCVGTALPCNAVKVIDRSTGDDIIDIDGEICISSPALTRGYYQNPYETLKRIKKHDDEQLWFHTGDIGRITSDGILYFRQGGSRVLNISGYCVYPSAVEDEICSVQNVITCCAVSDRDENGEPTVIALVIPDSSINLPSKESKLRERIIEEVTEKLNYMSVPKKIAFASNLPLSKNGSINYNAVRDYINKNSD